MAQIVKTRTVQKRRRFRFNLATVASILFFAAVALKLLSSLFLRTTNISLTTQIQEAQKEIAVLEMQNESLELEITRLGSVDRVDEIAANSGLSRKADNIIRIDENEETASEGE